jgi:secreted Zn-dependent insulinase-like peptidase
VRKVTTNPAHPEAKFSVGNLDTLADAEGKPVYADLRTFYEAHYGPTRMTVSVIGREDLDTLQGWVSERFGPVSGEPKPKPKRPVPFLANQLGTRIDIQSLRDVKQLEVQWVLPPRQAVWPSRSHGYLTHVLGHEGEGTLFAFLKQRGWVESLYASFAGGADDYDLLSLSLDLSDEGFAHQEDVVDAMLQYVRMLQASEPKAHVYDEARRVSELGFQFMEEKSPASLVRGATRALHYYPPQNVLNYWATWGAFNPVEIKDLLSRMTVDKMRLLVTSRNPKTSEVEPLYNVAWGTRAFEATERKRWSTGAIDPTLSVPAPNPWLPKALALKTDTASKEPTKVIDEPNLEVWHRHDTEFGPPRGFVLLRLMTGAKNVLRDNVMGALHERMLADSMELWAYPVKEAGLSFDWDATTGGLELRITGYDDKQPEVLAALLEKLMALKIDPTRFALEQAELARDWSNRRLARPYEQTTRAMNVVLNPENWSRIDAVATLQKLTPADLEKWHADVFGTVWAQLFVHGNHTKADAIEMSELVKRHVLATAKAGAAGDNRTRLLNSKSVTLDLDIEHDDSTLVVAYQGNETDVPAEARFRFLGAILETPFFGELRTKQQLGYIVGARFYRWDVIVGLRFVIQSSNTGPDVLLERVDTFVEAQQKVLAAMPDAELATIRKGLVAQLLEAHTQLYQRSWDLHGNLRSRHAWDHDARVAKVVGALDKATMLAFYDSVLLGKDVSRLIVRNVGRAHKSTTKPDCKTIACAIGKIPNEHKRTR